MLIGLSLAVAVYLLILIIVAWAATHPPRSPIFLSPSAMGIAVEEIELPCEGLTLRGWWVDHPNPKATAVLLHGYVMNRAENAALAARLHEEGVACLLLDFRAHGKSDGNLTGIGWPERADVLCACEFVAKRHPQTPRVLIGSSMGAAAAAFAIAEDPTCADGIVLDSSYSSLPSATLGWWRFIGGRPASALLAPVILVAWPMVPFNPFSVNVGRALARSDKPVLIIHGDEDDLVNVEHAVRNHRLAGGKKHLEIVAGSSHSETRWLDPERYAELLIAFIDDLVSDRIEPPLSAHDSSLS